jgi:hypothetical protein
MDYLFGSQDGREPCLYPAVGKENWICGLVECRRDEQRIARLWDSEQIIVGAEAPDTDKASWVTIVLSASLLGSVQDKGYVGSRIVWVHLATATDIPLVVIVVYIPHFGGSQPSADDTYAELAMLIGPSKPLPARVVKVVGCGRYRGFIPKGDRVLSYNIIVVPKPP